MELPRLMLVTDRRRTAGRDLVEQISKAVSGGVGIVQLREKDLSDAELGDLARKVRSTIPSGTPVVVNGAEQVAFDLRTGLHLPAAAPAARRGVGAARPLGRSAHDEAEAERAADEGVDYLVLGHVYATDSKPGLPGRGPGLVRRVARLVAPLPVYAIGGVGVARIPELLDAGAWGVAVCGPIISSTDPRRTARAMALALR